MEIQELALSNTSNFVLNQASDDQHIKKILEDKPKKLDMGCRWAIEELDIFLKYFRSTGLKDMDKMQAKLQEHGYKRTINNLLSVYLKNRNFLTTNTQCTAKDLSAIMADHYDSLEAEMNDKSPSNIISINPESFMHQKRKFASFNTKYIHSTDAYKTHKFEETNQPKKKAQKIKKIPANNNNNNNNNQNLQFENYENHFHKPKKMNLGDIPQIATPIDTAPNSKRKSTNPPSKAIFPIYMNDEYIFKKVESMSRSCMGKLNRKSTLSSVKKNTLEDIPFSSSLLRYINCELFYSTIDKPYFDFKEFRHLLGNVNNGKKYKKAEWHIIRGCLGKPRRYSNRFIKSQIEELNNYRGIVRNYLYNKTPLTESKLHPLLIQKIKELKPVSVGQIVLAFHPICNHMHSGSILTTTATNSIVKFYPNELGAINVPDTKILVLGEEDANTISDSYYGVRPKTQGVPLAQKISEPESESRQLTQQKILQDLDYNALAFFIKLLERKTALINELKNFNDLAESNSTTLNDKFYQEYGWTGIQINLLDNALKHVVTKSRLRGLQNFDVNNVMQGFNKLLSNSMKKFVELEQRLNSMNLSEGDIDSTIHNEVKLISAKNSEQMIDALLKDMFDKYNPQLHESNELNGIQQHNQQGSKSANLKMDLEIETDKSFKLKNNNNNNNNNIKRYNGSHNENLANKELHYKQLNNAELSNLIIDDIDESKRLNLLKLVENIIGILYSLKHFGELNITENKYLTDLCNSIYEENPEEFHQINNVLLNISSK